MVHTFASKMISVSKVLNDKGETMEFRDSLKRPPNRPSRGESSVALTVSKNSSADQASDAALVTSQKFEYEDASLGASFEPTEISIRLNLWDTVGTERYNSMNRRYFSDAVCAIILFDITEAKSLSDTTKWLAMVENFCPPNTLKVLCGNKTDLFEERSVT
mmetsp:Transcript_9218/g.12560  ORF Transcript_9218/g.12560 Transcript_9218/m.12560 type:complete len:161 (+) Transcript_9218:149-631(+)|eukprot:CAMPEP_0185580876 /NCGR_PEP_ID=MMETSP0434-20130131/17962_1 /TAXON_ID=626734 ORGANISM="Favella taraikaensis, Strain Fe Narragansett Bay" /NCGR_SAMPLE_ID=MMETSP0434 /ASSEMBLY_ACC=CAM_ASM_000379 /LENGTH=160 /DNA_ID=CAMNT_0028199271 /DNA_START=148 /DNA_END=630 /DNA_ORIENTATION=-